MRVVLVLAVLVALASPAAAMSPSDSDALRARIAHNLHGRIGGYVPPTPYRCGQFVVASFGLLLVALPLVGVAILGIRAAIREQRARPTPAPLARATARRVPRG